MTIDSVSGYSSDLNKGGGSFRKLSSIVSGILLFSFVISYTGIPSVAIYLMPLGLILLFPQKFRLNSFDLFVYIVVLILICLKSLTSDLFSIYYLGKYYFGFVIFYIFFRSNIYRTNIKLDQLLLIISLLTIFEAILINTVLPAQFMPTYPKWMIIDEISKNSITLSYYRPYSVGWNASITSSFILVLLSFRQSTLSSRRTTNRHFSNISIIAYIAIFACASATGILCFFLYIILHSNYKNVRLYILLGLIYVGYATFFWTDEYNRSKSIIPMIQWGYIQSIIELKLAHVIGYNIFEWTYYELLLGHSFHKGILPPMMGDNGWAQFIYTNGFLGLAILMVFLFKSMNPVTWRPILILMVSTFHYPTLFASGSQILLAYMAARTIIKISTVMPRKGSI
jgi:hypothetical protein